MQPSRPAVRYAALLLALLGVLAFVMRGYHDESEALHFRDFKQPYSSARCLLEHCDPYSEADTHAAFLRAQGPDNDPVVFDPYSALYPPFSLVMLVPIAALPYPAAHAVWKALIAASFSAAVLLTAELCVTVGMWLPPVVLLMLFTVSSTILLMLGQVSGLVVSLLVIAFACLLRERLFGIAVVCFLVALTLKPHDAALPFLYLLFAGARWRRAFWVTALLTIAFAVASLIWFAHTPSTAHWLAELRANLQGNSATGSVNDPGIGHMQGMNLADLQVAFAAMRDKASFYNGAAFAVSACLFIAWLVPVLRLRNTLPKHLLAIAAIACFALLPIYHRQYDTRILLLTFPAVAYLLSRRGHRAWGALGFGLLFLATVLTAHQFINHVMLRQQHAMEHAGMVRTLLLYRPIPEITLVLFLYFLGSLLQAMRTQDLQGRSLATTAEA